jgi:hypothetical protein
MNNIAMFSDFPDESRIWLYQTNRALSEDEMLTVRKRLNSFVQDWAAHGDKLWGSAEVVNPYFVAVIVNDALTPPSGCSIDASVKEIKALGELLSVDFFTRLKVTFLKNDEINQIDFSDLSQLEPNTPIFDPLLANLGELRQQFPVELEKSSFAHLV